MLTNEEIKERVTYHPPTEEAKRRHEGLRQQIDETLAAIRDIVPECREQSIAITKIEEAMFWANAGIARNHDKLPD